MPGCLTQPNALGISDSGKQSTASERIDRAQRFSDVKRVLVFNAHTELPNDPQACAEYIALPVTNAVRQFVRPCCTRCTGTPEVWLPAWTHEADLHSLVGSAKHRFAESESAKLFGTPSFPYVMLGRCGGGDLVPVWRNDAKIC